MEELSQSRQLDVGLDLRYGVEPGIGTDGGREPAALGLDFLARHGGRFGRPGLESGVGAGLALLDERRLLPLPGIGCVLVAGRGFRRDQLPGRRPALGVTLAGSKDGVPAAAGNAARPVVLVVVRWDIGIVDVRP